MLQFLTLRMINVREEIFYRLKYLMIKYKVLFIRSFSHQSKNHQQSIGTIFCFIYVRNLNIDKIC
jgi:hypothetical protein